MFLLQTITARCPVKRLQVRLILQDYGLVTACSTGEHGWLGPSRELHLAPLPLESRSPDLLQGEMKLLPMGVLLSGIEDQEKVWHDTRLLQVFSKSGWHVFRLQASTMGYTQTWTCIFWQVVFGTFCALKWLGKHQNKTVCDTEVGTCNLQPYRTWGGQHHLNVSRLIIFF